MAPKPSGPGRGRGTPGAASSRSTPPVRTPPAGAAGTSSAVPQPAVAQQATGYAAMTAPASILPAPNPSTQPGTQEPTGSSSAGETAEANTAENQNEWQTQGRKKGQAATSRRFAAPQPELVRQASSFAGVPARNPRQQQWVQAASGSGSEGPQPPVAQQGMRYTQNPRRQHWVLGSAGPEPPAAQQGMRFTQNPRQQQWVQGSAGPQQGMRYTQNPVRQQGVNPPQAVNPPQLMVPAANGPNNSSLQHQSLAATAHQRQTSLQLQRPLQHYTGAGAPQPQDLNDMYHRLTLRAGTVLKTVSRDILDQFVTYSPFHYDAVLPQKDISDTQTGYTGRSLLEANMFALTTDTAEFYNYQVDWIPTMIMGQGVLRSWKSRLWKSACGVAERIWPQAGYPDLPRDGYGLGAWDLGSRFIRLEPIPETVLENKLCNPLVWKGIPQRRCEATWNSLERSIEAKISYIHPNERYEIVETDMTELRTKGGDHSRWVNLRSALCNILYSYPGLMMDWIEDNHVKRLFFPHTFPQDGAGKSNPPNEIFFPTGPDAVDDMFVFRRGYRAVPRLYPGGVYVNVWTCFAPFYKPGITVDYAIDVILRAKRRRPHDGTELTAAELQWLQALVPVRVKTNLTRKIFETLHPEKYPTRYYRIWGFSKFSCRNLRVPMYRRDQQGRVTPSSTGQMMGFLDFCRMLFQDAFTQWPEMDFALVDETLKNLPAVKVHKTHEFYFPPWALEIRPNEKHSVHPSGLLSKFANIMRRDLYLTRGADELFAFLQNWMRLMVASDIFLPKFKLNINPTPLPVLGCMLPEPDGLMVYNMATETLIRAPVTRYMWNRRNGDKIQVVRFGGPLRDYMLLHFDITQAAEAFYWINDFLSTNSIQPNQFPGLHSPTQYIHDCGPFREVTKFVRQMEIAITDYRSAAAKAKPDVIFLVMPHRDNHRGIYEAFKYICDVELGTQSQVIDLSRWTKNGNRRGPPMFNCFLKFNRKMGGINVQLRGPYLEERLMPGTMIFGADVTHPAQGCPHSIAAIVATVDMPPATFAARTRIQFSRQEMIQEIQDMVTDLVRTFYRNNPGVNLERVFFFRDGVGEHEFGEVLGKEIPAVFNGLNAGGAGGRAKLVYVVCIKRHHTRFRQPQGGEMPPGCAVNELPVFPLQTSFYLCSHLHPPASYRNGERLGVCRSTFYHLLLDQVGISLPALQTMMYHMCFTYAKSPVALSVVPPTHYAHMTCTRARMHYLELLREDPNMVNTFPSLKTQVPWGVPYPAGTFTNLDVHPEIKDTMYYI